MRSAPGFAILGFLCAASAGGGGSSGGGPQSRSPSSGGGQAASAGGSPYGGEDSSLPEVQLFNTWLKRVAPGQRPDIFAAYGWESGRLFVQALTAAGAKPTRANVMAELKKIDNFDGNGMLATARPASKRPPTWFMIINVVNGKFVRADPPSGFICNKGA